MATIETYDLGPERKDIEAVIDGVRKMSDYELWYYLKHLCLKSAENAEQIMGDGGPRWQAHFVVSHFKSKMPPNYEVPRSS
jgi:hypothetical protein